MGIAETATAALRSGKAQVRAGEIKRWHFAHKHLQDCPLQHESPQILQARALLYQASAELRVALWQLAKKTSRNLSSR